MSGHGISISFFDEQKLNSDQAVSMIQSTVVFVQVFKGFGKSAELIDPEDLVQIQKVFI